MTDDFNLEALRYLLDELDGQSRAAFEAQLARDPSARAALRAYRESMADFARDAAPAEPLAPAHQRAALAAILSTANAEPRTAVSFQPSPWRRFVWPVAASFLLLLNLLQFFGPSGKTLFHRENPSQLATSNRPMTENSAASSHGDKNSSTHPTATAGTGLTTATQVDASITEELHRLEKLRADYASLERARAALNAEYEGIIRELAQRALMNKGVGRLAAMELVDAGSYARGERKGLVDIARGILTEPGIVTVEPPAPVTPTNPATPTPTPDSTPTPSPLMPIVPLDNASTINPKFLPPTTTPPPADNPSQTVPPMSTTPEEQPQTSNPPATAQPYAWSVFDETASRGYLNLYNLPTTSADQSLQLWVKPANSTTYQRMGEVPTQFYGGSGSLYYNLPGATQTPTEILITKEPRNATPNQPTGPTVLHGP